MSATLAAAAVPHAAVVADGGFKAPGVADLWQPLVGQGAFAFTRPALVLILSVGLLGWFFVSVSRKLEVVPSKRQFKAELIYGFVRDTIGRDVIGSKDFRRFLPLLFTLFTVILVNNLAGIIPFVQFPTFSRIAFPIVAALIVYVVYHVVGARAKGGVWPYLKSIMPPGIPGWIGWFVYILELVTFFITRPLTLALRLFGNMLAGHLLLLVFTVGGEYMLLHGANFGIRGAGVVSFAFTIVMTLFELVIEFLQAFIFTMLAAIYIAGALAEEH